MDNIHIACQCAKSLTNLVEGFGKSLEDSGSIPDDSTIWDLRIQSSKRMVRPTFRVGERPKNSTI